MNIVFIDNNASSSREKCHGVTPTDSMMCSGSMQMIVLHSWSVKSRRKSTASFGGGHCVIMKPFSIVCVWMKLNHISQMTVIFYSIFDF